MNLPKITSKSCIGMVAAFALSLLFVGSIQAQVPQLINYQGRVVVGSTNFNGSGQFKFALVNTNGSTTYWSNDGTSSAGSQPTAAVNLSVNQGLYSLALGDATISNMTAIPASVFNNSDVRLRIWFNDGTHGFQLLTPDQRIAAVGYAMMAGTVPNGSITAAQLANGAVGTAQLAPNTFLNGTAANVSLSGITGLDPTVMSALGNATNTPNGLVTASTLGYALPIAQQGNGPYFVFCGDSRTAGAGASSPSHSFVALLRQLGIDNNGSVQGSPSSNGANSTTGLGNQISDIWNCALGSQTTGDAIYQYYGAAPVAVNVTWIDATHATITSNLTTATQMGGTNALAASWTGTVAQNSPNISVYDGNGCIPGFVVGQTLFSPSVSGFPNATIEAISAIPTGPGIQYTLTMSSNYTGPSGSVTFYSSVLWQNTIIAGAGISANATGTWSGTTLTLTHGTSSNGSSSGVVYFNGDAVGGNHIVVAASSWAYNSPTITVSSTTGLVVGGVLSGPGLEPDTVITAISGSSLTISPPTTLAETTPKLDFTIPLINAQHSDEYYPEGYLGSQHQLSPYVTGGGSIANGVPGYFINLYGINDCYNGMSPTAILGAMHTLYSYARADGFKIIGTTVMPCTTNAYYGFNAPGVVADYNAINPLIKSDAYDATNNPDGWDYMFDVASLFPTTNNSSVNSAGIVTQDSRWYYDGIHPSDVGHGLIAQYIAAQFWSQGILTAAGNLAVSNIGTTPLLSSGNTFSNGVQQFTNPSGGLSGSGTTSINGGIVTLAQTGPASAAINLLSDGDTSSIETDVNGDLLIQGPGSNGPLLCCPVNGSWTADSSSGAEAGLTVLSHNPFYDPVFVLSRNNGAQSETFDVGGSTFTIADAAAGTWLTLTESSGAVAFVSDITSTSGNLICATSGKTVSLKGGTNAASGTVTLFNGTGTITSSAITSNSVIFLSLKTQGGIPGTFAPLVTVSNGSASVRGLGTDSSTYNWGMIISNQ